MWNCQRSKLSVLDCLCSCMCCCWSWLCYQVFWFFSMFFAWCVSIGFHGKTHITRPFWKLSLVCVLFGEVILICLQVVYNFTFSWLQLCVSCVLMHFVSKENFLPTTKCWGPLWKQTVSSWDLTWAKHKVLCNSSWIKYKVFLERSWEKIA